MASEQKINAVNTFENGMNTDIHPMRIDNKTLRYARNIDFITAGTGNQLILQKRDGNTQKLTITAGYIPVAIHEANNFLYIVSYNASISTGEIGTYPSPDYVGGSNAVIDAYAPLNNYLTPGSDPNVDANYNSPFRTRFLNFDVDTFVDIVLQASYDGSINIIITDDVNPVRLINSRFSVDESGKYIEFIKRRTGKSTNSYSDEFFNNTELIPRSSSIAKLTFNGVVEGGTLRAGGYRYFFRYINSDGGISDLIEESRLVSVHAGNTPEKAFGQTGLENTNKSVSFTLDNLDSSYYGVKVFYTISTGEIDPVTEAFAIETPYKISGTKCPIMHTGYEAVGNFNKEAITLSFSPIKNCKTITTVNDRLLLANTETEFSTETVLDSASAALKITEGTFEVANSLTPEIELNNTNNYANPKFEYEQTGYWKGETYELGIVYITDEGLSPVYPLQGIDYIDKNFTNGVPAYPLTLKEPGEDIDEVTGLNSKGVYRTASNGVLYAVDGNAIKFTGTKLKVDVASLVAPVTVLPANYDYTGEVGQVDEFDVFISGGWKVAYDPSTKKYYLWGTVTTVFDGEVGDLNNTVGFNTMNIPIPTKTVNFGYVRIDTDGKVYGDGLKINDNLSNLYGPPVDVKSLANGFFFVRRKRIQDKVMEGIIVPTAAFPKASRSGVRDEFIYPGNWLGCGTSTPGSPVVLAPVPSLCFPFGTDSIHQTTDIEEYSDFIDPDGNPVIVTKTTWINHSAAEYVGIPVDDRVMEIPISYVSTNMIAVLFTGVSVISAVKTTGVPIEAWNEDRSTITVKLKYFTTTYGTIPVLTHIQTLQTPQEKNKVGGGGDFIVRAPIKDYDDLKGWALYSPDTDCSPAFFASKFRNASMGVAVHTQNSVAGTIQYSTNPDSINESLPYSTLLSGSMELKNSNADVHSAKINFVGDGALNTGDRAFTGVVDKSLYVISRYNLGDPRLTKSILNRTIAGENRIDTVDTGPNGDDNPFGLNIFRLGIQDSKELKEYSGEDDKWVGRRPGVSINYGRYIGVKIKDADMSVGSVFAKMNAGANVPVAGARADDIDNRNGNFSWSINGLTSYFNDNSSQFGAYTQVFSGDAGTHMTLENWIARYDFDNDAEYIAISRRYAFSEFPALSTVIDLYGGDCYLGQAWKQVWFPKGVAGAPQASDLSAYKEGRENLGLLGYGYAIPIPGQSNYNFHLRVPAEGAKGELEALGTERTFIPLRSILGCRGNRQFETNIYNFGYSDQDKSDSKFFKLSSTAPYYKLLFPNRVYASDPSSTNDFVNGFTQFKGLNFKDYNSELGPITRIVAVNDKAYVIFTAGVGIIGINERTEISTDTGGVYVDNADVLAQKANIISATYGSSHPNSIYVTRDNVYGVDVVKRKIWRTGGDTPEVISDTRIQTLLGEILDELYAFINASPSPADRWLDVFTTYDISKGEITFTFCVKDRTDYSFNNSRYRTLVFNESPGFNNWVCETDDHIKYKFAISDKRVFFPPTIGEEDKLYQYDMNTTFNGNNVFRGAQYDAEIKFSIADSPEVEKKFENLWIVGDNPLPVETNYFTQFSNKVSEVPNIQILRPYTNVSFPERKIVGSTVTQVKVNLTAGSKQLLLVDDPTTPPPGRTDVIRAGDYITVKDPNSTNEYRFTVISYAGGIIYVNKPSPVNLNGANAGILYYGYTSILRLTDSSIEDGYGKIICQASNDVNSFKRTLRSKWLIVGLLYEGEDQIQINSIVSTYTRSFS